YWFVHCKVPCLSLMGHVFRLSLSTTWCTICKQNTVETAIHLLFTCPLKRRVWNKVIFEFLWITVNISDIIQSCTHLDFNSRLLYCKFSGVLSPTIIILTSIVVIWKAHYQFVFNSIPFDPHAVLRHIRQHLATFITEHKQTFD
ncbi:MAG: hypothetical protein EXX96DRAFT_472324, partial [Benjaminiella poitrasii]